MQLITEQAISAAALVAEKTKPTCGAVVTFEGRVRNHHQGRAVSELYYEAYEAMAAEVLQELIQEVQTEWAGCNVSVCHRVGVLHIGEVAVAIAVWAPHRKAAFDACEAMIDRIKQRVPIWKHESYQDGTKQWVRCDLHDAQ